jgi:predicted DNA-binding transcriptional regulator AlpA
MNNVLKNAAVAPAGSQISETADQGAGAVSPLLYDTSDLCLVLRCSVATIHRLKAANKLPKALRLGGQLRWSTEEVQLWIRAGMPDGQSWAAMRAAERGRG